VHPDRAAGGTGRGVRRGSARWADLWLRKNIALPFSAGSRMQIRVDAFKVFNRANFN